MSTLYRSHRAFGYELERTESHVILKTDSGLAVSPAHLLMEVTPEEAHFEARLALAGALARCRFLGLTNEQAVAVFQEVIHAE